MSTESISIQKSSTSNRGPSNRPTKLKQAYDEILQRAVWPWQGDKNSRFSCLQCKRRVTLRKGLKRIAHFAHYPSPNSVTRCNYFYSCSESEIHRMTKSWLVDALRRGTRIRITYKCTKCSTVNDAEEIVCSANDSVIPEYRGPQSKWIADIAIRNNETHQIKCIIEIFHTSRTTTPRPEPWYEVSAQDILSEINNGVNDKITLLDLRAVPQRECLSCKNFREQDSNIISSSDIAVKDVPTQDVSCMKSGNKEKTSKEISQSHTIFPQNSKKTSSSNCSFPKVTDISSVNKENSFQTSLPDTKDRSQKKKETTSRSFGPQCGENRTLEEQILNEPWMRLVPRLTKKKGAADSWKQERPCSMCGRSSYNPIFCFGYRALCKICFGQEREKLRQKFIWTPAILKKQASPEIQK